MSRTSRTAPEGGVQLERKTVRNFMERNGDIQQFQFCHLMSIDNEDSYLMSIDNVDSFLFPRIETL